MPGLAVASEARLAWLLAVLRLHSDVPRLRDRRAFAEELQGIGIAADPTRISRWESGTQHLPDRVLRGYASLLGLGADSLLRLAHHLRTSLDPAAANGRPRGTVEPSPADIDALLARIEAGRHDGEDWSLLTSCLQDSRHVYLPTGMWSALSERLLLELCRSVGVAQVRRQEAADALIRHPHGQAVVLRTVGSVVTAPGTPFVELPLSVLQGIDDRRANPLVLRMLGDQSPGVRRGAIWVAADRVGRRRVDEASLERLTEVLPGLLGAQWPDGQPNEAVDILAALDPARQERVLGRCSPSADVESLRQKVRHGLTVEPEHAHRVAKAVVRHLDDPLAAWVTTESELMLVRLVEEALFHVHRARRHHAGLLLGASPYAGSLPEAVVAVVAGADLTTTYAGLELVRYLRPEPGLSGKLLTWALHHPHPRARALAMMAMLRMSPQIDPLVQRQVVDKVRIGSAASVRIAATNLLGAHGSPLLAELLDCRDAEVRSTAAWWRANGPQIREDEVARVPEQRRPAD